MKLKLQYIFEVHIGHFTSVNRNFCKDNSFRTLGSHNGKNWNNTFQCKVHSYVMSLKFESLEGLNSLKVKKVGPPNPF